MGFEESETNNIRTDVELLKKDVHSISRLVDKLDVAIDNYLKEVITKIDKRVTAIERWKWLVVGGALVVGFAIAKYSVITQIIS